MAQLVMSVFLTILIVAFAMSNAHHVHINYGLGEPLQIRLISLLAVSFFSGVTFAWFWRMVTQVKRNSVERRLRIQKRAPPADEGAWEET